MRITLDELNELVLVNEKFKLGCVVDTNTVFAASMPTDHWNSWSEDVFEKLHDSTIPIFTNVNIRAEFLDLQRRVLIPEGLITMYDEGDSKLLGLELRTQLKLLKSKNLGREISATAKQLKFNEQQIKKFRKMIISPFGNSFKDWAHFCQDYVGPYIQNSWENTANELKIQFAGTRAFETSNHFRQAPNWKDMIGLIGKFGIGSADAMIVNFFLCSHFPLIVTADDDIANVIEEISGGLKYVLVPKTFISEIS